MRIPLSSQQKRVKRNTNGTYNSYYDDGDYEDPTLLPLLPTSSENPETTEWIASGYDMNHRYVQLGIVSFGERKICGDGSRPGVYTKIYPFLPWILDNARVEDN